MKKSSLKAVVLIFVMILSPTGRIYAEEVLTSRTGIFDQALFSVLFGKRVLKESFFGKILELRDRTGGSDLISKFPADSGEGMSDSLKIRYEAFAPVEARIYDKSGKLVAYGKGLKNKGFDRDPFIYDSFSDEEWRPLVSIYMPRRGYKLVLTSGNTEGIPVNLSMTTSTLTPDGDMDVSVRKKFLVTQEGGVIATIDGTKEPILSENIADKLEGEVTRYYTDWTGEKILRMNLHEQKQMPITGREAEAVRPLLHYDSSDEAIVSASEEGLLTATGYGEAIVSASDGNKVYSSLVIVTRKADSVSLPDVDMIIDERTLIRPHFTPASTTEREMHYTISEEGILEINEQGVMLALRPGIVRVTGTTDYGLTGSFTVQVTDDRIRPLDSIEILPSKASILSGEKKVLNIRFFPSDATYQEVEWYVEDEDILSLTAEGTKAVVTGLKEGTGRITALSMDGGYVAEAVIHVKSRLSQ